MDDVTRPTDPTSPTGRMTSSARRRYSKKKGQARTPDQRLQQTLLQRDKARARAERRLVSDTEALPSACHLQQHRILEFSKLFRSKIEFLEGQEARDIDDIERRKAVEEIMMAREAAGFEKEGEAARWVVGNGGQPDIDIAAELNKKFNSEYCKQQSERLAERRLQRQFLEWINPKGKGCLPPSHVEWLRECLNDIVRPMKDIRLTRIRAIYYILACRRIAGAPLDLRPNNLLNPSRVLAVRDSSELDATLEAHNHFAAQEPEYFTSKDFLSYNVLNFDINFSESLLNVLKEAGFRQVKDKVQALAPEPVSGDECLGMPPEPVS